MSAFIPVIDSRFKSRRVFRQSLAALLLVFSWLTCARGQEPPPPKPLHICEGHSNEVYTVCFSSDGQLFASATNREVKVWDATTGKERLTYLTRGTNVFGLAFHPKGQKLAVSVSQEVRIVDVATGKDITTFKGAPEHMFRIGFSPDGKHLAAAGGQSGVQPGNVRVWEVESGKQLMNLAGHSAPSLTVVYSGDGRHLVSGSGATNGNKAGEVVVWDAATGGVLRVLKGHSNNVYGVAVSRDGRVVASASGVRGGTGAGELKLWEVLTGKEMFDLKGHAGTIYGVVMSPDGRRLATAGADKTVRVWDVRTAKELLNISAHSSAVYSVAFSPDGSRIATASQDRSVKIWQLETQKPSEVRALSADQLQAHWSDLAADPACAHAAMCNLAAAPEQAVPYFRQRLRPVPALTAGQQGDLARWVRELDDGSFGTRERASRDLARLGEVAIPTLRETLDASRSAEVRKRVAALLGRYASVPTAPEELQALRAVAVLEQIGGEEAQVLLKKLALGVAGARLTEEARSALNRCTKVSMFWWP